jgi:hypothetical protein
MPDPGSIPFRQADGNGHYRSKQLPEDQEDFLVQLGIPEVFGDVVTGETVTATNQLTVWWGTGGHTIKGVPLTTNGIVVAVNGIATFETHPAGAIVGTDAVQTLTNKTFGQGITFGSGVTFAGGVTGLTKFDVGLGNVDNTSDASKNAAVATLTNKTISSAVIGNPVFTGSITGLTKANVGLANVDNTSDVNKPISSATQSALDAKEALARYNVANGYAPLGADSKVPLANLPDAVLGASRYQGTWNANTNIPPIPPAVPSNNGWYYVVSVPGNTSIDGITSWALGDWIISNGQYWQKVPNTDAVLSVNGKTGAVVLAKADIGLSNVDNTSDATKNSAAATLTNKVISGANNTLTVRLDSDVANNLPVNRLNGGTGANATTFWRGDGQWISPTGSGDVVGPSTSVDGEVSLFGGTSGKLLKTFGGAVGFAKVGAGTALTTVPSIGALDVNASLIHGQTLKGAVVSDTDEFLIWESSTSLLKSVRGLNVRKLPKYYLTGFAMNNNATDLVNDIDVAAGTCRDFADTVDITLSSVMTKRLDANWAAGSGQGGLDTGTVADGSYHVFVILESSGGAVDVLFSTSVIPSLPGGYTSYRRVGSITRGGGSNSAFTQVGDSFHLGTPGIPWNSAAARSKSLLSMSGVPTGILIRPKVGGYVVMGTGGDAQFLLAPGSGYNPDLMFMYVKAAAQTDTGFCDSMVTNTSGQMYFTASIGSGSITGCQLKVYGWWDSRGRDGY